MLPSDDFQAGDDAFTLMKAQEIEGDSGRIQAAKSFALGKAKEFSAMADALPSISTKTVNNSVADSKMNPK